MRKNKFTGMINKQELRAGNWVRLKVESKVDEYAKVIEILEEKVATTITGVPQTNPYSNLHPIPLTPELLKKIGFRKDDNDDLARLGVQYILDLPIKGECKNEIFFFFSAPGLKDVSFGEYTVNSAHGSNNIYYLHQLQNLYFALTGEELEINL